MSRKKPANEHRFQYEGFVYIPPKRCNDQTDKQYAAHCRTHEQYAWKFGLLRGAAQYAATLMGHHRDCDLAACRRAGACKGRRREDDWRYPYPVVPPCAKGARMEPVRAAVCRIEDAFAEREFILTETDVTFYCDRDVITGKA